MKITINNIKSQPEYITIRRSDYIELKSKAEKFEKRSNTAKQCISNQNARRTPQERQELARKAAAARWNNKGVK